MLIQYQTIAVMIALNIFNSRLFFVGASNPSEMLGYTLALAMSYAVLIWLYAFGFITAFATGNMLVTTLMST